MARRRGKPIHGWINLDKPVGISSAAAVSDVRKITGAAKVGHAGTLDPLASGVLPVALGEATKTVSILHEAAKRYRFTVVWGTRRSTDDAEGEIIATSQSRPDRAAIEGALGQFIGSISQIPPAFSAIKVGGQRAYALARDGRPVELAPRPVEIRELTLLSVDEAHAAQFEVISGKGMYVRSLARDLGQALRTEGHLGALVRLGVGPFVLEGAISLAKLETLSHSAAPLQAILPIETVLADIPALALSADEATRLRNGQPVPIMRPADREAMRGLSEDDLALAMQDGHVVALVKANGIQVQPVRVFNL
ncbi:MAG: tRNA pseudouridine(55) synthase TruB [Alphaproteobacteria bacterium]|nr:tRNA pseudouridine(55) synthase TruB [Alphaproteobacteria bacterium]